MKRNVILAAVLCTTLLPISRAQQTFVINGEEKSCSQIVELDKNRQLPNFAYFAGWKDADFEVAVLWARACANYGWPYSAPTREAFLRQLQDGVRQNEYNAAREREYAIEAGRKVEAAIAAEARRKAQEKAKQEELELAKQKLIQINQCESSSPDFQLYTMQEHVISDVDLLNGALDHQKDERRIAAVSGVRNLSNERANGEWIVQFQKDLAYHFSEYKRLGGKAKSPRQVKSTVADPCLHLR